MIRHSSSIALVALAVAAPAVAEPPPVRFEVQLGAFAPRMTTNIRLDGSGGQIGAELDFEDDFQLDDSEIVPIAQMDWWFKKKHGLSLYAFDLQRQSSGPATLDFSFGDEMFTIGLPIAVRFDTRVAALTYSYKFFNNKQRSFGANIGFNVNEIDASIATIGAAPPQSEEGDVTAPLPTIGVNGHVMLSEKWKFYGTLGFFALSYDDYDGVLSSVQGGFIHETFKHVGFGVGVNSFKVRVDSENDDFLGRINYGYHGVTAYVNFRVGGTG